MPAGSGEEPDLLRRRIERRAQPSPRFGMARGIEALGVDGVGQEQDAVALDALVGDEAIGDEARGALDALRAIGEDRALEAEEAPMAGQPAAIGGAEGRVAAAEIVGVAAAAGSVEILVARAAEGVDDVEASGPDRLRRGAGEGEGAPWIAPSDPVDPDDVDAFRRLGLARHDRDRLALARELPGHLPGDVLDTAGAPSQAFDDEGDLQGGFLGGRGRVSTRSRSVSRAVRVRPRAQPGSSPVGGRGTCCCGPVSPASSKRLP